MHQKGVIRQQNVHVFAIKGLSRHLINGGKSSKESPCFCDKLLLWGNFKTLFHRMVCVCVGGIGGGGHLKKWNTHRFQVPRISDTIGNWVQRMLR